MALTLPDYTPTSRAYTPGVIPETKFEGQNGTTTFVRFGNIPINVKLQMSYQNVDESVAFEFIEFYNDVIVQDEAVRITNRQKATKDIKDNDFKDLVAGRNDALTYRFAGPPQIQFLQANRYNVNIDLVGILIG